MRSRGADGFGATPPAADLLPHTATGPMTIAADTPRVSEHPVEARSSRNSDAPRNGFTFGAGWGMLACGLAVGLAVGQFTGSRSVQAQLYVLKQDVRQVRASADALTAAAGRGGETTSLLADLSSQRGAVREATAAWRETSALLAEADRPLDGAKSALNDAEAVAAAASATREAIVADAAAWKDAAAKTAEAAGAAGELTALREAVLAGRDGQFEAEATLERMAAVQAKLAAGSAEATAARDAAAATAAAHRDLIAEQSRALAAARAALDGLKELAGEASAVSAEAADASAGLRAAAVALADLGALKQMVAAAGADFPPVWQALDRLFALRDRVADDAGNAKPARLAARPADGLE